MKGIIVHVIVGLDVGGAEMMLNKLVTHSSQENYENIVVSLSSRNALLKRFDEKGIKVITLNLRNDGLNLLLIVHQLRKIFKKYKPTLIHSWMYHANLLSYLAAFFTKIPVIWNIRHTVHNLNHEKRLTRILILLLKYFSKYVEKIIFNSQESAISHFRLGYSNKSYLIVGNGFNTDKFKPISDNYIRRELKIKSDKLIFGMVARYHPVKGHRDFLLAAKSFLEEYKNTAVFILVGKEIDYKNRQLVGLIKEYNIEKSVYLLGPRSDIELLTASFDIATLASHTESFPNVIGEAMSCGVICVSTDVGGVSSLLEGRGVVVRPNNPKELKEAWYKIKKLSQSQKQRLKMESRDFIVENYSLEKIVKRYNSIYDEIIN